MEAIIKMTDRCAGLKQRYAPLGWLAALAMVSGMAFAQDAAPPADLRSSSAGFVPYLSESGTGGSNLAPGISGSESLLFSDGFTFPGINRARSWSGSWFGSDEFNWQINAERRTSALGERCHSLSGLSSPFFTAAPCAGLDGGTTAGFGLRSIWQPLDGLSLGLGYHQRSAREMTPVALNVDSESPFASGWYANSAAIANTEGLDLNMAYGFDAGFIGQLHFNLRLSQELNRSLTLTERPLLRGPDALQSPLTHARFGFNWHRGDFSGSLSSRYVDSILFNGQMLPASWTTVDINFAWQTPWDGSLSVGAKNLLGNEPPDVELGPDGLPPQLNDAFSSIPYVRYEQDL